MFCNDDVFENGAGKSVRKFCNIVRMGHNVILNALYNPRIAFLKGDSIDLYFLWKHLVRPYKYILPVGK